jgi:uncharacterized protein (DUF433 family)
MEPPIHTQITRTERGLVIAGTRITLYDIMGYLKEDWPPKMIRDILGITDEQIGGAVGIHRGPSRRSRSRIPTGAG